MAELADLGGDDVIDIKQFCAKDSFRVVLMEPFSHGEFTYAANGHIMVRVPLRADIPVCDGNERFIQSVQELFAKNKPDELIAIPELPPPVTESCPECEHGCAECDNGFTVKPQSIALCNTHFQAHYLRLIKSLPNARISPNGEKAAPFTFDGGDGLLMPCRKF